MKKLLILSPYDGFSHGFWREGLADYLTSEFEVIQCTLPPRFFSWRQRGNSLSFALKPSLQQRFDLIIATSMTDLSALRGLNRHLSQVPAIVYFHENQFAYPGDNRVGLLERQLTSIYTALSADLVVFNSEFNRSTFLAGAKNLLGQMPDEVPSGIANSIERKSSIVPVALDIDPVKFSGPPGPRLKIVWNHRWEYDKNPIGFFRILYQLMDRGIEFDLALLGESFEEAPPYFIEAKERLGSRIVHYGIAKAFSDYAAWLWQANIALVTSNQDFFGGSVVEAIHCGCHPILPNRLAYPDHVDIHQNQSNFYDSETDAVDLLEKWIESKAWKKPSTLSESVKRYDWSNQIEHYDKELEALAEPLK